MSKKNKKKRRVTNNFKKATVEVASPLAQEVVHITNKIHEVDKEIYDLEDQKRKKVESIVDLMLLSNDFKNLIEDYCAINQSIKDCLEGQKNRKKDLEFKKAKLTEDNQTVVKEVTQFMEIGDLGDKPVGLYNTECLCPVAVCMEKNVYLSYSDIRHKKCLKHKGGIPCKHLKWLSFNSSLY